MASEVIRERSRDTREALSERSKTLRIKSQNATEKFKIRSQSASRAILERAKSVRGVSEERGGSADRGGRKYAREEGAKMHLFIGDEEEEKPTSEVTRGRERSSRHRARQRTKMKG